MSELRSDVYFAIVPEWVLFSGIGDRALRLYGVLSLHADYSTRECKLGRKRMAELLGCSVDTVDRLKAELVEAHALTVQKRKTEERGHEHNVYIVHRIDPSRTDTASPSRTADAATLAAADAAQNKTQEYETLQLLDERPPPLKFPVTEVGGSKVTGFEANQSAQILEAWNQATETRFTSGRFLASIVRRIREHPELSLQDHVDVIRRNVQNPWWKGDPTPAVIYGSAEAFEAALNRKGTRAGQDFSRYN